MSVNVAMRSVARIFCHNGVHLGVPPNSKVEKVIISKESGLPVDSGRVLAEKMTLTPAGVHIFFPVKETVAIKRLISTFIGGKVVEKVIPLANLYEMDLMPEEVKK